MRLSEIDQSSYISSVYSDISDTKESAKLKEILSKYDVELAIKQYKNGNTIYRGMMVGQDSPNTVILADSHKAVRRAANTSNGVNVFVSSDQIWSDYPKRNQSFICSMQMIHGYGRPHVALPIGNPLIGIVPEVDFWEGFNPKLSRVRDRFGNRPNVDDITEFLDVISKTHCKSSINDYSDLLKLEAAFVAAVPKMTDERYRAAWTGQFDSYELFTTADGSKTILGWMQEYMNPNSNGFKFSPLSEYKVNNNHEVWFSGKAIFVEAVLFKRAFKFGDML
jgi:hypothetical protein